MRTILYVGNLPWATTEQELVDWIAPYARVISARIVTDRETGRSTGVGYITVPASEAAGVIKALNGSRFGGRVVTVREAQPRT